MNVLDSFPISLGQAAHYQAELFCQHHSEKGKAEEVYLNTLSIWAVNSYLKLLGYPTDLEKSESSDVLMRTTMDTAALRIPQFGQVECRRVLPGETVLQVPPEVWTDRIAYIAVMLNEQLTEASILGFIAKAKASLNLNDLNPLEDLTTHINKFKPIDLARWWQNTFQPGWQTIDQVLNAGQHQLIPANRNRDLGVGLVERGCQIQLGDQQLISMIVVLNETAEAAYDIAVELWPIEAGHLPEKLLLAILDDTGEAVLEAHTREESEKLEMKFGGEKGDQFSVRFALDELVITKNFVL